MVLFRYLRNIFIAILVLLVMKWPEYSIGMICILSIVFAIIVAAYKPYRWHLEGYFYIVCELTLTLKGILISILIIFDSFSNDKKLLIGWIAIVVSIILLIMLLAYIIVNIVLWVYGKCKNRNIF